LISHSAVALCITIGIVQVIRYIRYGCEILKVWIQQICNAVTELESVIKSLELDIVTPIYNVQKWWQGST